jgi:cation:H+ antiporter
VDIIYLVIGIILLTVSGNELVKGSVAIAKFLKLSTLVIGATIVSLGTSAPELIVSLEAALKGSPDLSLGNVIGSNISNMALVLGLTAIILPIPLMKLTIKWDWLIMIFASLMLMLFLFTGNKLGRIEGIAFVLLLIAYIIFTIRINRDKTKSDNASPEKEKRDIWFGFSDLRLLFVKSNSMPLVLAILLVIVASVGLVFGARFLVDGATGIARSLGVSERIIAVSVIAVGTSLPELATSLIAALRKEMDISIGNIIGSNIFNIFGILGITAIVTDIQLQDSGLFKDIIWMLAVSVVLILFIVPFREHCRPMQKLNNVLTFFQKSEYITTGLIKRSEGIALFLLYALYIVWVFVL